MNILGIHLDPPYILAALVSKGRQGIEIHALRTKLLDEIPNVKQLYIGLGQPKKNWFWSCLSRAIVKDFNGRIVTGISSKDFLIHLLELKIVSDRHINEAIAFQSEAVSHFNPADVISAPLVHKTGKSNTEALLFTVPREALKAHLSELQRMEIDPDGVSTIPLALCHFVHWKFPKLLDAVIIDLGSSETTCVLMENGKLKKAHAISGGVEKLLFALLEDRKKILLKKEIEGAAKQIDLLLLKPGLNPNLTNQLAELRQELAKIYGSFCRVTKREVIFTGRTDAFIHLREYLMECSIDEWPLTIEEQKFAISLGLALEQTASQPLQLRIEEFFPQKYWSRMGFYALSICAGSILLSGTLLGLGMQSSHLRKIEMLQALHGSDKKNVEQQIDQWIVSIEKNNKEYPYVIQAPKVTEVFSWLSTHPLLQELKIEGDPIDLRDIRYQLVSYPKINATKEPYLAKVEIEFHFKSAMNVRKFHEALRKGDDRVNSNLEITWDALSEGYRASFYLKNRSPHVP